MSSGGGSRGRGAAYSPRDAPLAPRPPSGHAPTADGSHVAYYDLGGDGAPLVLAHATGFCGPALVPMARELHSHVHGVALDERGHGASPRPPNGDYDWHGFGLDVLAVIDRLGLERPLGFGHSCGGAALLLAEQMRPGTFAALYCFEPIVYPGDEPLAPDLGNPMSAAALRRRSTFGSRHDAIANFAGKAPFNLLAADVLDAYVDNGFEPVDGVIALRCRREDEAAVFSQALSHDAFAHLGEVRCPVTLACGSETDAIGPDHLGLLAARLPHVATTVLPGIGHFGPLQDPAAVGASVVRALVPMTDTPGA